MGSGVSYIGLCSLLHHLLAVTWSKSVASLGLISSLPYPCRGREFSVHFELFSSAPTPSLRQSGRECYLSMAFGGRAVVFLGGGFLSGCAPEFLSSFAAGCPILQTQLYLCPLQEVPREPQLSALEPLRGSRTHSPSKQRSLRPPDQPRQPGHAKLVCRSSHRASLKACV